MTTDAPHSDGLPQAAAADAPGAGRSLWADARRRLARDRWAMLCLIVIVLYVLVGIGAAAYEYVAERSDGL